MVVKAGGKRIEEGKLHIRMISSQEKDTGWEIGIGGAKRVVGRQRIDEESEIKS
jgi:hypothetical protein